MIGRKRASLLISMAVGLLVLYVGSYLALSRRGFREADRYDLPGYHCVIPLDEDSARRNRTCVYVYYPLIELERLIGTGRPLASEPMRGLSK